MSEYASAPRSESELCGFGLRSLLPDAEHGLRKILALRSIFIFTHYHASRVFTGDPAQIKIDL